VLAQPEWSRLMWLHLELAAATQAWDAENVSIDSMPAKQGRAIFCSCPRLLSTLAKLTDRLKLVPDRAVRLQFVKAVHVALLGASHSHLEAYQMRWPKSQLFSGGGKASDHSTLFEGCALHNSCLFIADTLLAWGELLFFLRLSPSGQPAESAFFDEWVDSYQDLGQKMLVQLVQHICVGIRSSLMSYFDAAGSLYHISELDTHSAAMVSDELRPLLSSLSTALGHCQTALRSRSCTHLFRATARRLDCMIFDRLLSNQEPAFCTRAGTSLLRQDLRAVFSVFGAGGARYFRLCVGALEEMHSEKC